MKALLLNKEVVDVQAKEFEVPSNMSWMDCPDACKSGEWEVVDGTLQVIPTPEDTRTYADFRQQAYPSLADQADMQFHDAVDGTTTWQDAIQAVKDAYPKP